MGEVTLSSINDTVITEAFEQAMDIYHPEWKTVWPKARIDREKEVFMCGFMAGQGYTVSSVKNEPLRWKAPNDKQKKEGWLSKLASRLNFGEPAL